MTRPVINVIGWILLVAGILIVLFSPLIVFPGLEYLVGIETIVGRDNVIDLHQGDGKYLYTNPGAMVQWIFSVAGVGIAVALTGAWLLWSRRRNQRIDSSIS